MNYSAKLPRKRNESPIQQKKRASTSQSMSAPKHVVSKNSSSDHFLTAEAQERRILQSANSNYWNLSNQGLRLQREWTNLSNTRSIKRASEIVNHRVDRMYFMSGNSIKLKPRYDVDEEELNRMKEMQARNKETAHKRTSTRISSRSSIKAGAKKDAIDLKKKIENAGSEETGNHTTSSEVNLKKPDGRISPINGWESKDKEISEENVLFRQKTLHEENQEVKTEEIEQNDVENTEEKDELQGMRPDGRIDSSALNSEEVNNKVQGEINEQEVTIDTQGEINQKEVTDEMKEKDEHVAQENT